MIEINWSEVHFFFYKNLFYKNVEAEIDADFKIMLRTYLAWDYEIRHFY